MYPDSPQSPGPTTPDPAHNGCPTEKKRGPAPEGEAPPLETDQNALSMVKKKSKMK